VFATNQSNELRLSYRRNVGIKLKENLILLSRLNAIFATMKLTCWGAAGTVTGSMHLLELPNGKNILIDCGLNYENKNELVENNLHFPFPPKKIHAVILTHAHVDHCGNLPNLVRQGFEGPIFCTAATKELTYHLLEDSLSIQIMDSQKKQMTRKGKKVVKKPSKPLLYQYKHLHQTMALVREVEFHIPVSLFSDTQFTFYHAGHILGAASVFMETVEGNTKKTIGFTGDLGNYKSKLVRDPEPMPSPDFLVSESTYGGRYHSADNDPKDVLLHHIQKTCVGLSGKLIIPAFSVGRTQAIIFTLHQLYAEGKLPPIKIYSDSPLAIKTTGLYSQYINLLDQETQDFYKQHGEIFNFPNLYSLANKAHSEYISTDYEPCVIISAAGMVEGGRIQEHVKNNISNAFSTILIAGFCAEGTFGHQLLQGRQTVFINHKERRVMASIQKTDAFSAHPDHLGLLNYLKLTCGSITKKIFLVHADPFSSAALKQGIDFTQVEIASKGITYDL